MRQLFISVTLLLLVGCGPPTFVESAEYAIQVDSISAPGEIASNEPLTLRFYGTVGQNACFSFRHFLTEREGNNLDIVAVGYYESTGRCEAGAARLEGEPLVVSPLPPFPNPLIVTVLRPQGEPIIHEIAVR